MILNDTTRPKYSLRDVILNLKWTMEELRMSKAQRDSPRLIEAVTESLEQWMFEYRRSKAHVSRNILKLDKNDARYHVALSEIARGDRILHDAVKEIGK